MPLGQFVRLLVYRQLSGELTRLMNEGYEPPIPVSVVRAASRRMHVRQTMEFAAEDRRWLTAWLLRRYLARIDPYVDNQEDE